MKDKVYRKNSLREKKLNFFVTWFIVSSQTKRKIQALQRRKGLLSLNS